MINRQFPASFQKSDFKGNSYQDIHDCPLARSATRNIEQFTTFKVEHITVGPWGGSFYSPEHRYQIPFKADFGYGDYTWGKIYYFLSLQKLFGDLHVTITI